MEILLKTLTRSALQVQRSVLTKRTFMMSASRLEKEIEELKTNPYFEKYADKIATLQKTSPEEFLSRVESSLKKKEKKETAQKSKSQFTSVLQPKKELKEKVDPQEERLDKIMKLDLIQDKSGDEIKAIWQEYHLQKDVIAATIPASDFDAINNRAKECPIFLFAIPRSQGYEFIMAQFYHNVVHFTPLICYQVHKENAPECLKITHYTELKESKGIVLMRGEFDDSVLSSKEAQCLANQLQLYYNGKDEAKSKLLDKFTKNPDDFKHMDLIKEIENIKLV